MQAYSKTLNLIFFLVEVHLNLDYTPYTIMFLRPTSKLTNNFKPFLLCKFSEQSYSTPNRSVLLFGFILQYCVKGTAIKSHSYTSLEQQNSSHLRTQKQIADTVHRVSERSRDIAGGAPCQQRRYLELAIVTPQFIVRRT